MSITRLNPEYQEKLATEEIAIAKTLPSGASGNIYCYRRGKMVFVQFDGFTVPSTSWQTFASGFPGAWKRTVWHQLVSDSGNVVKVQISADGVLKMRKTGSANAYLDSSMVYICS